jgi:hypothetical protein
MIDSICASLFANLLQSLMKFCLLNLGIVLGMQEKGGSPSGIFKKTHF